MATMAAILYFGSAPKTIYLECIKNCVPFDGNKLSVSLSRWLQYVCTMNSYVQLWRPRLAKICNGRAKSKYPLRSV